MSELKGNRQNTSVAERSRRDKVLTEVEVDLMVRLSERGWTKARIARELGCSRPTVYRYLKQGGWCPSRGSQRGRLTRLDSWLRERLMCHDGNADAGESRSGIDWNPGYVGIGFEVKDRWRFTAKPASHFTSRQPGIRNPVASFDGSHAVMKTAYRVPRGTAIATKVKTGGV